MEKKKKLFLEWGSRTWKALGNKGYVNLLAWEKWVAKWKLLSFWAFRALLLGGFQVFRYVGFPPSPGFMNIINNVLGVELLLIQLVLSESSPSLSKCFFWSSYFPPAHLNARCINKKKKNTWEAWQWVADSRIRLRFCGWLSQALTSSVWL